MNSLQLSVSGQQPHDHCAQLQNGQGATTVDMNHQHAIVNGYVQPAGYDGHTHQFIGAPGGGLLACQRHALASNQAPKKPCNCGRK